MADSEAELPAEIALISASEARAQVLGALARPLWADAALSALVGAAYVLMLYRLWWALLASVVLVAIATALGMPRTRGSRVHQVADDRAVLAQSKWMILAFVPVPVISLLRTDEPSPWWLALAVGALAAAVTLISQRFIQRYQLRRLASGDYGRYDLL
ncbi:MAG TPA: hypothetical protein PKV13_11880 [Propionicimonas sp.]|nr:hypothetical protein [Propionicimonas sp.]